MSFGIQKPNLKYKIISKKKKSKLLRSNQIYEHVTSKMMFFPLNINEALWGFSDTPTFGELDTIPSQSSLEKMFKSVACSLEGDIIKFYQ